MSRDDILDECFAAVGEGWYGLVEQLVDELLSLGWDGDLHQVKQKFGGLRFYVGDTDMHMRAVIEDAENASLTTCEKCGDVGKRRSGVWIETLCFKHANGRSAGGKA